MVDSLANIINLLVLVLVMGAGSTLGLSRRNRRLIRRQARDLEAAEQWRYEALRAIRGHNLRHHPDNDDHTVTLPDAPEWMVTDEPEDPLPIPLPKLGGPHA